MITTCSTFAVYSAKFTASAVKGIAAADDPDGDPEMEKRWDFLYKFEKNFNHWYIVSLASDERIANNTNFAYVGLANTSTACSIMLRVITDHCCR